MRDDRGTTSGRGVTGWMTRRRLIGTAVTVVVLAAVMLAMTALGPVRKPKPSGEGAKLASPATDPLFAQALAALRSGDETRAVDLLERTIAADPGNAEAKAQLKRIRIAKKTGSNAPKPDPDPSDNDDPDPDPPAPAADTWTKPVAPLASLLPVSAPDYRLGVPEEGEKSVTLYMEPTAKSLSGVVSQALVVAYDKDTPAAASAFAAGASKVFPKNAKVLAVGKASGRFGTDGQTSACVSFSRGRFAFEVIVSSADKDPATLMSHALTLAKLVPATR